jgi:uncharacterized membrane protein
LAVLEEVNRNRLLQRKRHIWWDACAYTHTKEFSCLLSVLFISQYNYIIQMKKNFSWPLSGAHNITILNLEGFWILQTSKSAKENWVLT